LLLGSLLLFHCLLPLGHPLCIISLSVLLNAHDADKRFREIEERATGISLRDKYAAMDDANRPEIIEIIEQLQLRIDSSRMMEIEFERQDERWTKKRDEVKNRITVLSQIDSDDLEMISRLSEILNQYRNGLKDSLRYYLEMIMNAESRLEESDSWDLREDEGCLGDDVGDFGMAIDENGVFVAYAEPLPELPLR
jgi:hypothetical protein